MERPPLCRDEVARISITLVLVYMLDHGSLVCGGNLVQIHFTKPAIDVQPGGVCVGEAIRNAAGRPCRGCRPQWSLAVQAYHADRNANLS